MGRMLKLAMAGLAVMGAYKLAKGGRARNGETRRLGSDDEPAAREPRRDAWSEVDEASYESFPASDPPSYTRGKP